MTDARNAPVVEPTLADLEAFERLLRESLHQAPVPRPPSVTPRPPSENHSLRGETSAFAELTRLVEAPLPFEAQAARRAAPGEAPRPEQDIDPDQDIAAPAPPGTQDPLLTFEDEMRHLEASMREEPSQAFDAPERRYASRSYTAQDDAPEHAIPPYPASLYAQHVDDAAANAHDEENEDYRHASEAERQLADADERLAMEAAAAAQQSGAGRSGKAFYALGGVAVIGLLAVGATFAISGRSDTGAGKPVPVIAARTDPAKEKPANPGGIEIPDQNKQILASRTSAPETKPAQVVNTTEQPIDLNQVTKRDAVRVITPSPYPVQPAPVEPSAPEAGEAKRVQSVRLSDPVIPAPAAAARAPTPVPSPAVTPPMRPVVAAAATPASPVTPQTPPAKIETRPVTAANPAAPASAPAAPGPRPPQTATAPRQNNAPLNLLNPAPKAAAPAPKQTASAPAVQPVMPAPKVQPPQATPAQVANAGSGGFAVQLAWRPTEADARSASSQLASRYAGALGGRPGSVVMGENSGKPVYRVRVNGFAQADAVSACEKIRAAGGDCFVTRQ